MQCHEFKGTIKLYKILQDGLKNQSFGLKRYIPASTDLYLFSFWNASDRNPSDGDTKGQNTNHSVDDNLHLEWHLVDHIPP